MPKSSGSLKAVFYALGANGGIALAKGVAAFFTGSGAMLAEALHSFADCGNQVLLLVGMQQAKKLPTPDHPMGYGRVVYFWSMMVGVLLFSIGGLFSVWHGAQSLLHPEPVKYLLPSLSVLLVAVVLESVSLRGALQGLAAERGEKSLWRWFRETRQSELLVITGEDIAALAGLAMAFVALALTGITGSPIFDALGSIAVGLLLMGVSFAVTTEVKSLITGESASPEMRAAITEFVASQPEVERIVNLITFQLGAEVAVAVKAKMVPMPSADALVSAIDEVEERLQAHFPNLRWSFFEPDAGKPKPKLGAL
ncbi:cation diffusion facilitator family transporter [Rhodoferax sediminis]|uniref:Cation diffusion facilitator family transporter n=1 Tax=Rhodoferax sediminis TaxID=2509614 RepID=A0A515D891_9BURK|nr:cation diffusion facilitator family transporter [Rhodoferax sediminis]QDL36625.1 cation diffusion facilitator family transporter [Rhodoferax sediminis]